MHMGSSALASLVLPPNSWLVKTDLILKVCKLVRACWLMLTHLMSLVSNKLFFHIPLLLLSVPC